MEVITEESNMTKSLESQGYSSNVGIENWLETLILEIQETVEIHGREFGSIVKRLGINDTTRTEWCSNYKQIMIDCCIQITDEFRQKEHKLINEIEGLLKESEKLCKILNVKMPSYGSQELGLYEEKNFLLDKIGELEKEILEKRNELIALTTQENDLLKSLGRQLKSIPETPIIPTIDQLIGLQKRIDRLEREKYEREERFIKIKDELQTIFEELKLEPSLDFEKMVLSNDSSAFTVTDYNMKRLEDYYRDIYEQYKEIKADISNLRAQVEHLWEVMDEDVQVRDEFRKTYVGHTLEVKGALKNELKRCEEMKRQNIKIYVEKYRKELESLWVQCRLTDEQRNEFIYLDSDLYTEDLLEFHEREVDKLKNIYSENSDLYSLLNKHDRLWEKMLELENKVACMTSRERYNNRGGQLLKEEKERNKLSKQIPELENQIVDSAFSYQAKTGKPFLTFGMTVEEHFDNLQKNREENKKKVLSTRKQEREMATTPAKGLSLYKAASTQNLLSVPSTLSATKRKLVTPDVNAGKRPRVVSEKKALTVPKIKVNNKPVRYSIERTKRVAKARRISQRKERKKAQKKMFAEASSSATSNSYLHFEKEVTLRSTTFGPRDNNSMLAQPLLKTPTKMVSNSAKKTPQRTPANTINKSRSPNATGKLTAAPCLKLIF